MGSIFVTICALEFWQCEQHRLSALTGRRFKQTRRHGALSVWGSCGQRARACVWAGVLFAARSKGLSKESINWATVWELRWLWWAVGWWKERPAGGRKWGGSDEVTTSAVKFCQEVCVWANGLAEEVLSQEAWPRERPVVLASPPRAHVTALHKVPLGWRHNSPFPGPAPCARVCATGLRAHTLARCACIHQ